MYFGTAILIVLFYWSRLDNFRAVNTALFRRQNWKTILLCHVVIDCVDIFYDFVNFCDFQKYKFLVRQQNRVKIGQKSMSERFKH